MPSRILFRAREKCPPGKSTGKKVYPKPYDGFCVFRRYSLDEVRRKVVDALENSGTGLSGIELAELTGINRMTITKYLDVMLAKGLVRKKKVGTVNVWFLEKGISEIEFPVNYIQVQQRLIDALIAGREDQSRRIVSAVASYDIDQIRVLTEVIMPAVNTVHELYSRGRLEKTERRFTLSIIYGLIDIVRFNARPVQMKQNASALIVVGSEDKMHQARCAAVGLSILGWNAMFIGNVENDIDPFFDIDFSRFVSRVWADKRGALVICVLSSSEEGLRFLVSTSASLRSRLRGELRIASVTSDELQSIAKESSDFAGTDLQGLLEWCERSYGKK